jgi:Leucine-rich repeat (LRR) protein
MNLEDLSLFSNFITEIEELPETLVNLDVLSIGNNKISLEYNIIW